LIENYLTEANYMMKNLVCAALFLYCAATVTAQEPHSHSSTKPVVVTIRNSEGQSVGTATLTTAAKGVKISLDIKNLPPGQHSIHIHQSAKCDPPDFKTAGAHFHAGGHMDGMAAGDIPDFSLIVGADGTAHVTTIAPNVTLGDDDHSVFSEGGTAIVIHAVAESTTSGAPARIACGVIVKP
jgi:superoxide dismutase, Cu-Zn family